ncbi:hypothetical protein NC652_040703 [Populus alba x Populus x berolinensis]|nr:hypothetical protein NC652_040703 [Populus alba x Populus x berolinensis]
MEIYSYFLAFIIFHGMILSQTSCMVNVSLGRLSSPPPPPPPPPKSSPPYMHGYCLRSLVPFCSGVCAAVVSLFMD